MEVGFNYKEIRGRNMRGRVRVCVCETGISLDWKKKICTYLNAIQDLWAQHIDTSIDLVANEFLGLFYKPFDLGAIGMVDNHTVLWGIIHFGYLSEPLSDSQNLA